MNIPDKAVEAAAKELYAEARSTTDGFDMWPEWEDAPEIGRGAFRDEARAALKAAAPFIAAQALRDAAEEFGDDTWESVWAAAKVDDDVSAVQATTAWMRTIADDMEDGQ